ncbi:MAG: aldo/keto reductase [Phycisphaeraceae bacterium]|nr:aldo/keto reductase [Phycisphaeraceae bacterium]
MEARVLGKTGWKVGVIGFGAWGIGGQWGEVSRDQAMASMNQALDSGMTFFDTADAYGEPMGISEIWMGEALRPHRDKVIIATKVGNWGRRIGHPLPYTHWSHVELCCDASLYRMKIDAIDLYQSHIERPDETTAEVLLEGFDRLLEKGKIRAFGLSTRSVEGCQALNRDGKLASVQLDYSLLNTAPEQDLLPWCLENNVGVIVRGPLAQGVCAGKFTPESRFTDWVRRRWNEGEGRERFLAQLRAIEKLRFLENERRTLAQAALRFAVHHPAVSVAIPGAKSPEQAAANAQAGRDHLSESELEQIRRVLEGR